MESNEEFAFDGRDSGPTPQWVIDYWWGTKTATEPESQRPTRAEEIWSPFPK